MKNVFLFFAASILVTCVTGSAYAVDAACAGRCVANGFTFNYCQQQCGGEPQPTQNNAYENAINSNALQRQQVRQMAQPNYKIPDDLHQKCYVQHDPIACKDIQNISR
jgi:hypothetical protein